MAGSGSRIDTQAGGAAARGAPSVDLRLGEARDVVRTHVIDLLQHRWQRVVTTVVAGAGFGKSVAVGQAMRANELSPRGVEVRVSCRFGCEDPDRLIASVADGLGVEPPTGAPPLARLQAVITERAPLPVGVVVDDVELLPPSGAELLDQLVRSRPANLHLLLCGRRSPAIGLARLRAAGEVLDITADDMRFDQDEIAALAGAFGAPVPEDTMGGWPALLRLSLAAPDRTAGDFLWEEVISGLSVDDRSALRALSAVGSATPEELQTLIGEALDPDAFCERVPLVRRDGTRLVAHEMWRPFLADLGSAETLAGLAARALEVVAARGDVVATGQLAIRLADGPALGRAAVELVRTTLGSLPEEVAASWTHAAASGTQSTPELELLRSALAHSRVASEPSATELDAVMASFRQLGAAADGAVAIALAALVADANRDLGRLLELSLRAREVAEVRPDPLLGLLGDGVEAAAATLQGDLDRALALFGRPRPGLPAGLRPEAFTRLHWHVLLLVGRASDAAAVAAPSVPAAALAAPRPLESVARWLGGDPDVFDVESVELGHGRYEHLSERDQFDQASFVAVMAAATGDPEPVDLAVGVLTASPFAAETGPDGAVLAVARAAQRCVYHDDDGAVEEIDRFLDRSPLDPLTDAYLRRSLAVPYVCSPRLREAWDQTDLGPSQRLARSVARTMVDARHGRCPEEAPEPLGAVTTALPLPWSVELACRAAEAGRPWGTSIAIDLADRFGDGVAAEVDWQADHGDAETKRGAAAVRAELPVTPPHRLSIGVLGPLMLHRDGAEMDAPELRRVRVRELLTVLVVERSVARDRAIELLWPDQDPAKGRANLRVTLSHLLAALEPARERRGPAYFVRASSTHLALPTSPSLVVDLWEVERLLAEAEAARQAGDAATRTARLAGAVDQWRARALPDLDGVAELESAAVHIERRLADATLELGELELVGGSPGRASARAERVLTADIYDERAHRLAIAVRLHVGDRTGAAEAIDRLHHALDDLGAGADDTTQVLLRQAERLRLSPAGSIR